MPHLPKAGTEPTPFSGAPQHLRALHGHMILQAIGDALMDEHNVAQVARPGTSLARPATGSAAVSIRYLC
jgi:hypothetical protein